MPDLTEWFPPNVKPVHIGSYETTRHPLSEAIYAAWWDGNGWRLDSWNHQTPLDKRYSKDQFRPWRGLKEKPE